MMPIQTCDTNAAKVIRDTQVYRFPGPILGIHVQFVRIFRKMPLMNREHFGVVITPEKSGIGKKHDRHGANKTGDGDALPLFDCQTS